MAWRLAKSLETLRTQVNSAYPNRNKASDGSIGDSAHQKVASDHNPNAQGVVCALDLTHHAGYFDAHALADVLIANRHPNLKYVISNRRIAGAWTGWKWQNYSGSNPHTAHIHVSVGVGDDGKSQNGTYDNTSPWTLKTTSQGGTPMTQAEAQGVVTALFRKLLKREPDAGGLTNYTNHIKAGNFDFAVGDIASSQEFKNVNTVTKTVEKIVEKPVEKIVTKEVIKDNPEQQKRIEELGRAIELKDKEIATLKAQTGESNKWETFRALIRELIGR